MPDAYVYFMNITKADGYAIDVALVPANNIQDVLYNHEYTVNGYFKHNNITVFVFGIDDGYFFKKTAVKLDFPAFEKKIEPEGDPYITPALDIYEWKFAYKNNLLAFLKVGWFDFFDKKD